MLIKARAYNRRKAAARVGILGKYARHPLCSEISDEHFAVGLSGKLCYLQSKKTGTRLDFMICRTNDIVVDNVQIPALFSATEVAQAI